LSECKHLICISVTGFLSAQYLDLKTGELASFITCYEKLLGGRFMESEASSFCEHQLSIFKLSESPFFLIMLLSIEDIEV
jgi:hypothetical protein